MPPIDNVIELKEKLNTFLFHATNRYATKWDPMYDVEKMPEIFNELKVSLALPKNTSEDLISLIITNQESSGGWQKPNFEFSKTTYQFENKLEQQMKDFLTNKTHLEKQVPYRVELIKAAIRGGYLENVNTKELFNEKIVSLVAFKNVLENCPVEVLRLGQDNILKNINNLGQHHYMLNAYEVQAWTEDFKKQIVFKKPTFLDVVKQNIETFKEFIPTPKKQFKVL